MATDPLPNPPPRHARERGPEPTLRGVKLLRPSRAVASSPAKQGRIEEGAF